MKSAIFGCSILVLTILEWQGNAVHSQVLFNSAAHYWPFNRETGIVDSKTNVTGVKYGQTKNIYYKGPGYGFLHTDGKAWIDLGNFTDSCLVEPARCQPALTVFLWLKYAQNKNWTYFVGTSSHLTYSKGFTIYKESDKRAKDSIVLRVNDGQREWSGNLTLKPKTWSHVAFTWDASSGLALFQNCRQMALIWESKLQTPIRGNRSNILEHHLTLSGAQNNDPNLGSKASYEDLAVLYRKIKPAEWDLICHHKLEAPQINITCQSSKRWLTVSWRPPPMTYDILTGYNVWHWSEIFNWSKISVESGVTFYNLSNLNPGSSYKLYVQNMFRFGSGKTSSVIDCRTETEVLNPPLNISVEKTSSSAIMIKWLPPPGSLKDVIGYKITYSVVSSLENLYIAKVGAVTSFLLTELQMNTSYIVRVSSYGDKRFNDSNPASVTVKTDYDDRASVTETFLELKSSTFLTITWKKPRNKYKKFSYRTFAKWKSHEGVEHIKEVYTGNATTCDYFPKGGLPSGNLNFEVFAYVVEEIPLVNIVEPPRDVVTVSVGWSHLILKWISPFNGTAIDFADSYLLIVSTNKEKVMNITTTKTHARIDGLKQMTYYLVSLQAWNKLGYGPPLNPDIHFRTLDRDECSDNSHDCDENAICSNTRGSYICKCKMGFMGDGKNCEEIPEGAKDDDFCPTESLAGIEWHQTLTKRQAVTTCPPGTLGTAMRLCSGNPAVWHLPDLSNCVSKWMYDIKKMLDNSNVSLASLANQLSNLTDVKNGKPLYAGDLKLLVNIIGVLTQRGPGTSKNGSTQETSQTFLKDVVGTASNILDEKNLQTWNYMSKESQTTQASSLIDSLDVLALDMANSSQTNVTEMENIVMTVTSLDHIRGSKSLVMEQQDEEDNSTANAVSFPASVLKQNSSTGSKPGFATFVSYKTLGPLLTPRGKNRVNEQQEEVPSINSAVVSLNLRPLTANTFKDPVIITLRHTVVSKKIRRKPSCVFLEVDKNGSWSEAGCHVNSTNITHTVCHCFHLTSFAVLMSVKEDISQISKGHQLALSLITYIGISISIVALCLAFLTFHFFRFSKSGRTFVHKNLAISMIFAQVIFLFGINKTGNKLACKGVSIALHYFFLVSFAWMALEGVMLYLMLVKVFHTKTAPTRSKKIFFCVGWGLPIVIVVTSGVMFHQGYGTPFYCWLSLDRGFIWSFVGPVLVVLAFNFMCLGMTFRVMATSGPSNNRRRTNRIRRWSKACMLLTCILGLTWLFGVLYINQESLFMAYFFTIFNTLQGLFIFLFHCVGDEKVRLEYRRVLCCIDPDKRYLLTKPSDSNSKSESSSKSKSQVDNFKAKNQTLSSSVSSVGTVESKRNTFVVHVSDGKVRVRGVATDEQNRHLVTNQRQSQSSHSSFGQAVAQIPNGRRHSSASAASEDSNHESELHEEIPLNRKN
ncbi:unnamed protein product [Porites evermanni]|uniref:Uncharacterized protein n=1 Tax=Porites evermanni TaxID=104178 RepID=A0ABN8QT05_9CNID|nr:unnamed protein product [Porites evermanni]